MWLKQRCRNKCSFILYNLLLSFKLLARFDVNLIRIRFESHVCANLFVFFNCEKISAILTIYRHCPSLLTYFKLAYKDIERCYLNNFIKLLN